MPLRSLDAGWEITVLAQFVIPAKAGRQLDSSRIQIFLFCSTMDAHFRGHDNFLIKLSHYRNYRLLA